jgi:isopenicillin N synthase-like dioxygenase
MAAGRSAVAEPIGVACAEIGFFAIVGHGVSGPVVSETVDVTKAFFDLPLEEKLRVRQPRPDQSRGYLGLGAENLSYSRGDQSTADPPVTSSEHRLKKYLAGLGTEGGMGGAAHPTAPPNGWRASDRD